MDLSLLPTPVSEYNNQRTGPRFTVRSANSPSYVLNHRQGLRISRARSEDRRENFVRDSKKETCREEERGPPLEHLQKGTDNESHPVTGNQANVSGQEKETSGHKTSGQLKQNGTLGKALTESGSDRSGNCNPECGRRGRTEWRRHYLPSRSKSLDWRTGASSPDRGTKADKPASLIFSGNHGRVIPKEVESLEKRRRTGDGDRIEGIENRVMSAVKAYNSAGTGNVVGERSPVDEHPKRYVDAELSHIGNNLERVGRGQSLPSRLRLRVGSDSGIKETATSFGPKGGQSILERIEKLYGSGKTEDSTRIKDTSSFVRDSPTSPPANQGRRLSYEVEAGGTFPKRFSRGEKNSLSVVQSSKTFTFTPNTDTKERSSGVQWQGKITGSCSGEGGVQWGRGALETGTRSLDRARSRNSLAAQLRSARAAARIVPVYPEPHTFLEEKNSASFRDLSGSTERRASGNKDKDRVDNGDEKGGLDERMRDRIKHHSSVKMERVKEQEREKETDDGVKEEKRKYESGVRSASITEDVFEDSSLKSIDKKTFPEKVVVPSAANVRNKIHQFEALTQRAQGSAAGQFLIPRRTFSVPAQLGGAHDGVKKSGSERAIHELREKWQGLREAEEAGNKAKEKVTETIKKNEVLSVSRGETQDEDKKVQRRSNLRAASIDEVGLRLGNRDRRVGDLVEREGKEDVGGVNSRVDDFGKYSRLKDTLALPLNGEAKRQRHRKFYIDETDFARVTSPEKSSHTDITNNDTPPSLLSNSDDAPISLLRTPELSDVEKATPTGSLSPVSDEDKTPTNPPESSPFLSHHSLPENTAANAGRENESTPVSTHTRKTPGGDAPHLLLPHAASPHSCLPDLSPPDVTVPSLGGGRWDEDLVARVAGWNTQIKGWSGDEDDDDDDEGTEKDEDSNYDSDSGDSSVTITSNMSQSDRRSFSVSLADLCNFGGVEFDDESENENDEWLSGRRSASLSSDVSALSCVSMLPNEELDRLLDDVKNLGDSTLQHYEDVQVVVLHKDEGVGLGFTMAGGVDQNKPITVHKVFPSGVAAHQGSIMEGDQVLSINGTALCGSTHWEALRTLRRARTRGMGVVVLRRGGVGTTCTAGVEADNGKQAQTEPTEPGQRVCVRLEKQSRDLGFSLVGGVGSSQGDKPLSIQKIFQGGPVNKVCPGDELLEIQGVSVMGMRRLEAWTLIRRLPPGPVDVVLHRPIKHSEI